MRAGRGPPASKRVLANAQTLHHHYPPQTSSSSSSSLLSRRHPAPSSTSSIISSSAAPSTRSGCKATGAQQLHHSQRRLVPPINHHASGDSVAVGNPQYSAINRGKPTQKGAFNSQGASEHHNYPSLPSHHHQHPQSKAGGGTLTRTTAAGIPRLTPSAKKNPPEQASTPQPSTTTSSAPSSAIARLRGGTTVASTPVQYSTQYSSSAGKRLESQGSITGEEEKRRKGRRVALFSKKSPQKDRTSTASSPAALPTGNRHLPIVSASTNVTRRNTEGSHRRYRELPEASSCGGAIAERHRAAERIPLEPVTPELEKRGPSKSAIHRGEVSRGRNRDRTPGAPAEVASGAAATLPQVPSVGATNQEIFAPSSDYHQPRPAPQRQQGRRKAAAVPPVQQRDPSPKEEEEVEEDSVGVGVMVGREEEEEGGGGVVVGCRLEDRPRRMDVRKKKKKRREEEEEEEYEEEEMVVVEECEMGVQVGEEGGQSSLEKQVLSLGLEKCELESKLAEVLQGAQTSREEVDRLRKEIAALECQKNADVDALEQENRVLRERLRELAAAENAEEKCSSVHSLRPEGSALSDTEKEQLLLARSSSGQALSVNSTEAMGGSTEHPVDSGGGDGVSNMPSENALCPTPEWDKQSSSSLSEVSVACLQDRILQMEETHYSTNEELQATLQELADLQAQLTELQSDNERLSEEKSVLLESLCRQTEKLEDTRSRADTLQELLLGAPQSSSLPTDPLDASGENIREANLANGGVDGADLGECSDREQKLVELLKSAQEERENLLSRLEDLNVQLEEAREAWSSRGEESARLQDRVRLLESAVEAANAERRELDKELAAAKEESSGRQIQISRLSTLLDNARAKIEELEQAREVRDKCELDNLLDNARKEKDALESQVASLQEKLSHSQCEVNRLKDSVCSLQEECKVARNNAKSALSDLEYQLEQGRSEMALLAEEVRRQTEEAAGACAQSQRHLEDKRTLKAALSEAQRATLDVERRLNELKNELEEEKKLREDQNEEWERFQSDLLVTVRVANDFKNEAKLELEKYVLENRGLKDKIKILEAEMDKLKAVPRSTSPSPSTNCTSAAASNQSERRGLSIRTVSAPPAVVAGGSEGASVGAILSSVMHQQQQQEAMALAVRRQKPGGISRADSRLSVKSLIESIENATKQVKAGPGGGSRSSSTSSLSSITSADTRGNFSLTLTAASAVPNISQSQTIPTDSSDSEVFTVGNGSIKTPLRDQQQNNNSNSNQVSNIRTQRKAISVSDNMYSKPSLHDTLKGSGGGVSCSKNSDESMPLNTVSILSNKMDFVRRNSYGDLTERKDPLSALVRNGGSRRNALLKWCQNKTVGYRNIDITNFSSSWNDGLAFCALLHTYLPDRIPYDSLGPSEKRKNFSLAFSAAESVGIPTSLNINEMIQLERPDWQQVMSYVTSIYKHFET